MKSWKGKHAKAQPSAATKTAEAAPTPTVASLIKRIQESTGGCVNVPLMVMPARACASCPMNSYGSAPVMFKPYEGIGRYRMNEFAKKPHANIQPSGNSEDD